MCIKDECLIKTSQTGALSERCKADVVVLTAQEQ